MAQQQVTLGGVNVELGNKTESLDLMAANTTASLYLTAAQVARLREILKRGAERLAELSAKPKPGKTPKLQVNVKVGTKQTRIFVPGVAWRT